MAMKLTRVAVLVLIMTAAAQADEKFPKCFNASREGHCSAVQVNGQRTVRLTKKTKKMLEPLAGLKFGQFETRYEVPQPVRGALALEAGWIPEAVAYFGAPPEVSILVRPLEGQNLETRAELSTASSVRAGGSAVVTEAAVVQGNRLPPGKYLLQIRLSGSKRNWEQQTLFIHVVD
jgi:hypothetical protein